MGYQQILEEILKQPGNDRCADCSAKGPRWASVNLGIFVCIRCSGIHRNMGTHISKVKSVSLDKWQPDMIRTVQLIGNANAQKIYEGRLPSNYHRPRESDAYAIEQWIKDKYDRKRWYDRSAEERVLSGAGASAVDSPQASTNADDERRARREQRKKQREQRDAERAHQTVSAPAPTPNLLFDTEPATPPPPAQTVQATSTDAFTFSDFQSATSNGSGFIDAASQSAAFFQTSPTPQQVPAVQAPVVQAPPPQKRSKDQIMSMFRSNQQQNTGMGNMSGMNNIGGMSNMGMNNMGGMNMGGMNMGGYGNMGATGNMSGMNNMGMNMGMGGNMTGMGNMSGMNNMGMNNMGGMNMGGYGNMGATGMQMGNTQGMSAAANSYAVQRQMNANNQGFNQFGMQGNFQMSGQNQQQSFPSGW